MSWPEPSRGIHARSDPDCQARDRQQSTHYQTRTNRNVAEQAEEIITEEVERMMLRLKTREVTPTIVSLQEQLELVRMAEIERVRAKLGVLTPQQQEAIEAMTRGIITAPCDDGMNELQRFSCAHRSDGRL